MNIENVKESPELSVPKKTVLNIMYTQNFVAEKFAEIFKAHDLSPEQYNVLRILRGRKGSPANMCSIQESMIAKTSNTTRLVDKLLIKGFVTRDICPQNRRKMEVNITTEGLLALQKLDPVVDELEESLLSRFTLQEMEHLNELLEKFRIKSNN